MRIGRAGIALAVFLFWGCRTGPESDLQPPGSLGPIPADLPLPPGFLLDPETGESFLLVGTARRADLRLVGPHGVEATRQFFRDHLRLSRWKAAEGPGLAFRKGEERIELTFENRGEDECRVRLRLNPEAEAESAHE